MPRGPLVADWRLGRPPGPTSIVRLGGAESKENARHGRKALSKEARHQPSRRLASGVSVPADIDWAASCSSGEGECHDRAKLALVGSSELTAMRRMLDAEVDVLDLQRG